jgi:hypothetical protein
MSHDQPRPRSKLSGIEREEERAWLGFYRSVRSDMFVATEVIAELDAHPQMKQRHLALYLCCKQSLRVHKARQQRGRRIGQFVRRLCHGVFVVPIRALKTGTLLGGQLAIECLPELTREPAVRKIGKLTAEKEFAAAQAAFDQEVYESTAPMAPPTSSPSELPRADTSGALTRKQA